MEATFSEYIANHVFLPPRLPQASDYSLEDEYALAKEAAEAAKYMLEHLTGADRDRIARIRTTLKRLALTQASSIIPPNELLNLRVGETLAYHIKAQNAGLIIHQEEEAAIFEAFQVSPSNAAVMGTVGKLVCSYPGPAVAVGNEYITEPSFCQALASFLSQMNDDVLDSTPTTVKAKTEVVEERDSAHPRYITELLVGILDGIGESVDVPRVTKRIGDEILWRDGVRLPWRRSPIWTVIRVGIQTTLFRDCQDVNHTLYKTFLAFFMARLLEQALEQEQELSCELLFCMRAKLARRLWKLGESTPKFLTSLVMKVVKKTQTYLESHWDRMQEVQSSSVLPDRSRLSPMTDCNLTLPCSREYIKKRLNAGLKRKSPHVIQPTTTFRIDDADFALPRLLDGINQSAYAMLADFEVMVHQGLGKWVEKHKSEESSCLTLSNHTTSYIKAAKKAYEGSPEDKSIMLLTAFFLWMALDQMVIAQHPLLQEYSPELDPSYLEHLLLRNSLHLSNTLKVSEYLHTRHESATAEQSVFSDNINSESFSVRFFEKSPQLQLLKARIESDAQEERNQKLREWKELMKAHDRAKAEAARYDHEYRPSYYNSGTYHSSKTCRKCVLLAQTQGKTIKVHEWPLPAEDDLAKATVFELQAPPVFTAWRDITFMVLAELCRKYHVDTKTPATRIELTNYPGLERYYNNRHPHLVTFASTAWPFEKTHYNTISIPATDSQVCVNHGLQCRLYDIGRKQWVVAPFLERLPNQYCAFQPPLDSPFQDLYPRAEGTSLSANDVIALQSKCPKDINVHQFVSFGTLRIGERIRWLNILRELRTRILPFDRNEVKELFFQAAFQVGPAKKDPDGVWQFEWHADLACPDFGFLLLKELRHMIMDVEKNWLRVGMVELAIMLTSRLLASNPEQQVCQEAYSLLQLARKVTSAWKTKLVAQTSDAEDELAIEELQQRLLQVAATYRATFDIDEEHLRRMHVDSEDVSLLMECAIRLRSNFSHPTHDASSAMNLSLARDRRLSHRLSRVLDIEATSVKSALTSAVRTILPSCNGALDWQSLSDANRSRQWMRGECKSSRDGHKDSYHLNLLDGQLLVNGSVVGQLPQEITSHSTFQRIFGQMRLESAPSDELGMDYVVKGDISGHQVFLALRGEDLLIRARHVTTGRVFELVPHMRFTSLSTASDLPTCLLEDYVHWMLISASSVCEIALRPLTSIWDSSSSKWIIRLSANKPTICISCNPSGQRPFLVDNLSQTFSMLSQSFERIEKPEHVMVTAYRTQAAAAPTITAQLVRYNLSFYMNKGGELQCHEIPNMVVDSDQSIGTLIGLKTQLVLRSTSTTSSLSCLRRVIVPCGKPQFNPDYDLPVWIVASGKEHVRYQTYVVDDELGRLRGNGTLSSELYAVLLHAYTSHCIPDPLTGQTGCEEALQRLRSASCSSFRQLCDEDMQILKQIAVLTPSRSYYPSHLKCMQTVEYFALPILSQHNDFLPCVQEIVAYFQDLRVFYEEGQVQQVIWDKASKLIEHCQSKVEHSETLYRRAMLRCAMYYPGECQASIGRDEDVVYPSAGCHWLDPNDPGFQCVRRISSYIHGPPTQLPTSPQLCYELLGWDHMTGIHSPDSLVSLDYDCKWLTRSLKESWLSLYDLCRRSSWPHIRFQLLFSLAAMGYGVSGSRSLLPTILAFALFAPEFATSQLKPPPWQDYDLSAGFLPVEEELHKLATSSAIPFGESFAASLPRSINESDGAYNRRRQTAFEEQRARAVSQVVSTVKKRWETNTDAVISPVPGIDIVSFVANCRPKFRSWHQNCHLRSHIRRVQNKLEQLYSPDSIMLSSIPASPCTSDTADLLFSRLPRKSTITFESLLHDSERTPPSSSQLLSNIYQTSGMTPVSNSRRTSVLSPLLISGVDELKGIIAEFKAPSKPPFYGIYGRNLESSCQALSNEQSQDPTPAGISVTDSYLRSYRSRHCERIASMSDALSPASSLERILSVSGLWPRTSLRGFLRKLTFDQRRNLPLEWRRSISSLALDVMHLQQLQRSLEAQQDRDGHAKLSNDIMTVDDALKYPDWLLIQIDSNFTARAIQKDVAKYMLNPRRKDNVVLQLNMGEGKSSVIVPLVSSMLANGISLVRVMVLKHLASPMFQILFERLSGLANRRIFYFPFSRKVPLSSSAEAETIGALYRLCASKGGVLVAQPEHALSFKLMSIDKWLNSPVSPENQAMIASLLETQRWLDEKSKDILDESDEILHVRYQLVYATGEEKPPEDHPDRWTTTQQVFRLLRKHAHLIKGAQRGGIEVQIGQHADVSSAKTFPRIRVLDPIAGKALIRVVAEDILKGSLPNLALGQLPATLQRALLSFITSPEVSDTDITIIRRTCEGGNVWKGILLLRGLLAHGVLLHTLKDKRWRVDYGLHPSRTMLAVPYRAKDVPTANADFAHPDVMIALTHLAYYYGGLSETQLDSCFQLLFKFDNPAMEYEKWIEDVEDVPNFLRDIDGVNIEDSEQRTRYLIPLFSSNMSVVDFFLAQVVFPKSAKEFTHRLTTSAWDLAEHKPDSSTVGFSGTNDNQHLLPTSIHQCDPVKQSGTNAMVLSYLLRPENDSYLCYQDDSGKPAGCKQFLRILAAQKLEIQVLLDVGAQMIDMPNLQLSKFWLSLSPPAMSAAVFFTDDDELAVVARDGSVESLLVSPFNQRLDECLIYLDDAHTRGTDLKLPPHYRAAVVLGPKLTKDRLLQGCMRMRQLGHGQSLMFFAPPEVNQDIRASMKAAGKNTRSVHAVDIVRWTMLETCASILHHLPNWGLQGVSFSRRQTSWLKAVRKFDSGRLPMARQLLHTGWYETDTKSLEELYSQPDAAAFTTHDEIPQDIMQRMELYGVSPDSASLMGEEQERQVSQEVERQAQVERPPKARPAPHSLHPDVRNLVVSGVFPAASPAYIKIADIDPFLDTCRDLWNYYDDLIATKDFAVTIQGPSQKEHLRPVHWVLSMRRSSLLIMLSPYEVNLLLPDIRKSKAVHLHIYAPRVTKSMDSLEDLTFYTIPPMNRAWTPSHPTTLMRLNLWAGQLYLKNYQCYQDFCMLLGLYTKELKAQYPNIRVQLDGFIKPEDRKGKMNKVCNLGISSLPMLKELFGLRRKGGSFMGTHIGKIMHGCLLTEEDF